MQTMQAMQQGAASQTAPPAQHTSKQIIIARISGSTRSVALPRNGKIGSAAYKMIAEIEQSPVDISEVTDLSPELEQRSRELYDVLILHGRNSQCDQESG